MLPVLPPSGLAGDGLEPREATLEERPQRWTKGDGSGHRAADVGSLWQNSPGQDVCDLSTQERCPAPDPLVTSCSGPDSTIRGSFLGPNGTAGVVLKCILLRKEGHVYLPFLPPSLPSCFLFFLFLFLFKFRYIYLSFRCCYMCLERMPELRGKAVF